MIDLMEYKGYSGTVEYSDADKTLLGKVLGIRGLISYEGDSLQSLRQDFEGAIEDYLEMCTESGEEPQKSYEGSFSVLKT